MRFLPVIVMLCICGCSAVKDEDRKELDGLSSKSEEDQIKAADAIVEKVMAEGRSLKKLSKEEREAKHAKGEDQVEYGHLCIILSAIMEVEENGKVSDAALKRVRATLPFCKRLREKSATLYAKEFIDLVDNAIKIAESKDTKSSEKP